MSDAKETVIAVLDEMAPEVMLLEAGDLISYGEVLSKLENLNQAASEAEVEGLAGLTAALQAHMEGLILGQVEDQEGGLELLGEGVNLAQRLMRGEGEKGALEKFLGAAALAPGRGDLGGGPAEPEPGEPPVPQASEARQGEAPPPLSEAPSPPADEPSEAAPAGFDEEDADILSGFVAEALEHLESIEVNTLILEDTPDDPEAINAVFRPFHTIKGVSGFLNLTEINHLAHQLENLLDQPRAEELVIDSEATDVIIAGVDALRNMIEDVRDASTEKRPPKAWDNGELLTRIAALMDSEEKSTAEQEEVPRLGEVLVDQGAVKQEAVDHALETQKETKTERRIGEILVSEGEAEPAQVAKGMRAQRAVARSKKALPQEVKIDTQKLDNLLDMVGELVIAQSMVQANPVISDANDRKLAADMNQLGRITSDLQKSSMAMRMVPIKQTFQRMARVVRDTAKKKGKLVRLELEGEGTEIDRNMVEKFYDPLMHMVRNSVDHGIETPEERLAAGKPREGVVVLAAYHKGGSVCIEIRDDGQGLDRQKLIAKAQERGIIDDPDSLGEEEAYHLIFQPGFSTAEVVTDISGRGVGMDVVRTAINELRGKVQIKSQKGQGSTFTIALPLTLAIIDGMVVQVAHERFILPTVSVVECVRPTREEYSTVQGRGEMINIRGHLLPMVRLHNIVSVQPEFSDPWDALVVVVEHHGQQRCLLVDRLIGRQEVVIKSLGQTMKHIKEVAGGAIMGDGRVGLILDVEGTFRAHEARG